MDKRKLDIIPPCLSISFKRKSNTSKYITADDLFKRFVKINSCYFWNLNLKEVFENCQLLGYINPYCLLIGGPDIFIQSMKIAYKKRLLRAPESFYINFFGDVEPVQCESILPSQFVSLDESLCYIIYDLNLNSETSSFDMICSRLAEWYPSLQLPPQFLILATLRSLLDAGQVYYTGYGYNIMTTDKMMVAEWLGQQTPSKSDATVDKNTIKTHDPNSISDASNEEVTDSPSHSKIEKSDCGKDTIKSRPANFMDTHNLFQYPSSPPAFFSAADQSIKRTKTRSAVRQFFSKLKPRQHKSRPNSTTAADATINGLYDEESTYYAFSKSQPMFFSSNMEFSSRLAGNYKELSTKTDTPQNQWLWNTSLQSLSNVNPTCRRSISSHSKLSTKAIHDESPPQNVSTLSRNKHSKSRYSRHREKSFHSSKTDRSSSGGYKTYDCPTNDTIQNDSGVHSTSGSHGQVASEISIKPRRQSSHHRYKSLELEPDDELYTLQTITPPTTKQDSQAYQRLTRSFSTRLSTLDPVAEGSKWNSQDNRHVMFQEHSGTMY